MESSRNSVEPSETLPRPGPSHTPCRTLTTPQPLQNLVQEWWNPGRTLAELLWNLPGPPRSPRRTWWNTGGTLVENPCGTLPQTTPDHPAALAEFDGTLAELLQTTLAEPGKTLVEPSWNLTSNHSGPPRSPCGTWWGPGETLVEHYPNHPLAEPGGTLPQTTPDHPCRTRPQPSQNLVHPCGTLPQTTPDHPAALAVPGGTLVEPSWNPRGTLPQSFQLLRKKRVP